MEELKENLFSWYEFKENSEILVLGNIDKNFVKNLKVDFELNQNKKYDYCLMVGTLERACDFEKTANPRLTILEKAKKALKEDGKLLVVTDNKFGIKNWNGKLDLENSLDYRELTRTYNAKENGLLSKTQIQKVLKEAGFENFKFYYMFPDYNLPNLIFTDDYNLTEEDVGRNFECYEKGEFVNFNENKALIEILNENKEMVKFFVNSYFIEVSNSKIDTDIKYVSFTNYRKSEYRIATILKSDIAVKKAVTVEAQKHINQIVENIEKYVDDKSEILEKKNKNYLQSKFIKDTKRLDLALNSCEDFSKEFKEYTEIIYKKAINYSIDFKEKLPSMLKELEDEKLSKLHFLENAYLDMIPKNCFKIDGKYCFFDQEWMENYLPAEYIIYRALINTSGIDSEKLFKEFGILENKELFEKLDEEFSKKVMDENLLHGVFKQEVTTRGQMVDNYAAQVDRLNTNIDNLNVEIAKLNNDIVIKDDKINDLNSIIQDRENQLNAIAASLSWRITKPLRDVSEKVHEIKNKKH